MTILFKPLLAALLALAATAASAQVRITEWMYGGAGPEYIEFTNLGSSAVNFNGWSFDDDSRLPGSMSLSGFGLVAAGESVILTEGDAAAFRTLWNLAASVKVIGGNANNLGRADEINLYDASNTLVSRLTYGDQTFAGTIRTQNFSGNPKTLADLEVQTVSSGWVLASVGDAYGSYASALSGASFDVGSPGSFALAVPEPASAAMLLAGVLMLPLLRKRGDRR